MKYFLHDTNSFQDEKITELFMTFGYEGLGLFYTLLEKLALQEKPVKTEVLKAQLKVGKKLEKCWKFMESLGIISSNNGETFNERILSYSETYEIKKEKTRKRVLQFRERQNNTESVTRYKRGSNAPKVKESKVKRSKGNSTHIFPTPDFEIYLSQMDTDRIKEYVRLTKQKELSKENVNTLFTVFKTKNFTGAKSYKDNSDIIRHFFETLKFENFEINGTHKQSLATGRRTKSSGAEDFTRESKEWFNNNREPDS